MKLKLDFHRDAAGNVFLYFPFMNISDIHWFTKASRGKRLCGMLARTQADRMILAGDIVDGEVLFTSRRWEGDRYPWYRQGIAHILRKAGRGTTDILYMDGNHEPGLPGVPVKTPEGLKPRRRLEEIYGIRFAENSELTAPGGSRVFISHGDEHDNKLFGTRQNKEFWYRIGTAANNAVCAADEVLQRRFGEDFSAAAAAKKLFNNRLGVAQQIVDFVDASPYDVYVFGHHHMAGFQRTPKGQADHQ